MAKDIELDDFDLDSDDDFGFDDFDSFSMDSPSTSSREVVVASTGAALKGFTSSLANRDNLVEHLGDSLPRGYRLANDEINDLRDFKDAFVDGMEPVKKDLKSLIRSNKNIASKVMPKKWAERLDEWARADLEFTEEKIDPREAEITSAIGDIFKLQNEQDIKEKAEDEKKENEDKAEEKAKYVQTQEIQQGQHEGQVKVLNSIREGVDKQVAYQDEINIKYQQKHLEIQYRQLYALRDILETGQRHASNADELLKAIRKNTSLPEHVKVQNAELMLAKIKDRGIDNMVNTVSDVFGGMFEGTKTNIIKGTSTYLRDKIGTADGVLGSIGSLFDSDNPMTAKDMIAMGAGQAGSWLTNKAIKELGPDIVNDIMAIDSTVEEKGKMLEYIIDNKEDYLVDFANSETSQDKPFSGIKQFLKDSVATTSRSESLSEDRIADADEAVAFTRKIERSIVEVIPGYLQRQLKVLTQIQTGRSDVDSDVYDITTGSFNKQSKQKENLQEKVFSQSSRDDLDSQSSKVIKNLVNAKDFTEGELNALKIAMIDRLSNPNQSSTLTALATARYPTLPKELSDKFKKAISSKFLDAEGKLASGNIDSASNVSDEIRSLRDKVPNVAKELERMRKAGLKGDMLEGGFLDPNSSGGNKIDYEHYWGLSNGKKQGDKSNVDSPESPLEGGKGTSGPLYDTGVPSAKDTLRGNRQINGAQRKQQGYVKLWGDAKENNIDSKVIDKLINVIVENSDRLDKSIQTIITHTETLATNVNRTGDGSTSSSNVLLDELTKIREDLNSNSIVDVAKEQRDFLEEIRDITSMLLMGDDDNLPDSPQQRKNLFGGVVKRAKKLPGHANRILRKTFGIIRSTKDKAVSGIKPVGNFVKDITMPVLSTVASKTVDSVKWALGKGKSVGDIHIKGRLLPALTKMKMDAGEYVDKDGNIISSLSDIIKNGGPIWDKITNRVVLSIEDIEAGLVSKDDKTLIGKGIDLVKLSHDKIRGLLDPTARAMLDLGKNVIKSIKKQLDREVDIYVLGETEPRILSNLLTKGLYYTGSVDDKKPITSWKQIEGNVYDQEGKLVLSMEDMKKGLVDHQGNLLKTLSEKAADWITGTVKLPFKIMGGVKNWVKGKFKRDGKEICTDVLGGRSYGVLKDILNVLVAHTGYEGELGVHDEPESKVGKLKSLFTRKSKESKDDDEDKLTVKDKLKALFSKDKRDELKAKLEESKLSREAVKLKDKAVNSKVSKFAQDEVATFKEAFNKPAVYTLTDGPGSWTAPPFMPPKDQNKEIAKTLKVFKENLLEGLGSTETGKLTSKGIQEGRDKIASSKVSKFAQDEVTTFKEAFNKPAVYTPVDGPGSWTAPPFMPPKDQNKEIAKTLKVFKENLLEGLGSTETGKLTSKGIQGGKDKLSEIKKRWEDSKKDKEKMAKGVEPPFPGEDATVEEENNWLKWMLSSPTVSEDGKDDNKPKGSLFKKLKTRLTPKSKEGEEGEEGESKEGKGKGGIFSKMLSSLKGIKKSSDDRAGELKKIGENTSKEKKLREGSWQSQREKKKEEDAKRKESGVVESKEEKSNKSRWSEGGDIGAMLTGGFSGLLGGLSSIKSVLGSIFGTIGTIATFLGAKKLLGGGGGGAEDMLDGPDRRKGPKKPPSGKKGFFKRAAKGLWEGAKTVGSFAVKHSKVVGRVALRASFHVARSVAMVALSKPMLVLGAVGLTAYAGYKFYKYLTRFKVGKLDEIRYAQYGFDVNSEEHRKPILVLEGLAQEAVIYIDGIARIDNDKIDATKILEAFALDPNEREDITAIESFLNWYRDRFMPVYLTHLTALKKSADSEDIFKTEKLSWTIQYDVAKMVDFTDKSIYSVTETPLYGHPLTYVGSAVSDYVKTKIEEIKIKAKVKDSEVKPKKVETTAKTDVKDGDSLKESVDIEPSPKPALEIKPVKKGDEQGILNPRVVDPSIEKEPSDKDNADYGTMPESDGSELPLDSKVNEDKEDKLRRFVEKYPNINDVLTEEDKENLAKRFPKPSGSDVPGFITYDTAMRTRLRNSALRKINSLLEDEGLTLEEYSREINAKKYDPKDDRKKRTSVYSSGPVEGARTARSTEAAEVNRQNHREIAPEPIKTEPNINVRADVDLSEMVNVEKGSQELLSDISKSLSILVALNNASGDEVLSDKDLDKLADVTNEGKRITRSNRGFSYNMS